MLCLFFVLCIFIIGLNCEKKFFIMFVFVCVVVLLVFVCLIIVLNCVL